MKIADAHRKEPLVCGQFHDDDVCTAWLNARFDEGYVLFQMRTNVLPDRERKNLRCVVITVTMRLDLPSPSPEPPPLALRKVA